MHRQSHPQSIVPREEAFPSPDFPQVSWPLALKRQSHMSNLTSCLGQLHENDTFLHTITKKLKSRQGILRLKRHLIFLFSKLFRPICSRHIHPREFFKTTKFDQNQNQIYQNQIYQNQIRSKSLAKEKSIRKSMGFCSQGGKCPVTPVNSSKAMTVRVVYVCAPKGECDDCGRFEEDGGYSLMREHEVKLARKASWHIPAIISPP